jgi:predicted nucleic acid-binding protein
VADAGPLVALAKVNRLDLLGQLFDEVHIPPAVRQELAAKSGPEAARLDDALARFIRIHAPLPHPPELEPAIGRLGPGEREAIALAYQTGALLLMDERRGRGAARLLGLKVTGVAGVLVEAKAAGLIPRVRPVLEEMRGAGYWLSDALLDSAAHLAGEADQP